MPGSDSENEYEHIQENDIIDERDLLKSKIDVFIVESIKPYIIDYLAYLPEKSNIKIEDLIILWNKINPKFKLDSKI